MYEMTQLLRAAATLKPAHLATVYKDRVTTWAELRDRTSRLAGAIRRLGIKKGEHTAILALNSDRYIEYLLGSWWAGAVVVPMNTRWSPGEHAYSLNDSETRLVLSMAHSCRWLNK
jgi:acyl-CoA synthetase (AMP-forming)/AMP-acid ligase II